MAERRHSIGRFVPSAPHVHPTRSRCCHLFGPSHPTLAAFRASQTSFSFRHTHRMHIAPEPSTARGEITLQPSYFTSSLYLDPLREDLTDLTALFTTRYVAAVHPFKLFKELWSEQGWCWLHMRTHDGRGRQAFLRVTERIFVGELQCMLCCASVHDLG